MKKAIFTLLAILILLPITAMAGERDNDKFLNKLTKADYLSLGAVFHGSFSTNLTDEGDNDSKEAGFEVTRMYLDGKSTLTSRLKGRTTLDFGRIEADGHEYLLGYIKYAYFDAKLADPATLRFGLQGTAFPGAMDKICGYRYVTKSATDHFSYFSSADVGVSLQGKVAGEMIAYQLGLLNGNGYKDPAPGDGFGDLMIEGAVHVKPLKKIESPAKGLGIHAVLSTDNDLGDDVTIDDDDVRTTIFGGALSFQHEYIDFLFEALMRTRDIDDYDMEMLIEPMAALKYQKFALFVLYGLAKNSNQDPDSWTKMTFGASYKPDNKFALTLAYHDEQDIKWSNGSETQLLTLHTQYEF